MYAYIKGKLASATAPNAIIEANGIGYLVFIPANVFAKLPQIGAELILHTSYIVREQSQALYGFLSIQDRDLFELLMSVSGIGPKLALNICGHLSLTDLHRAIQQRDLVVISRVPGIGKKSAERLVVELGDKIQSLVPAGHDAAVVYPSDPRAQKIRDAMSALVNLGYNQATAQKAIKKALHEFSDEIDLTALITSSLQRIEK